MFLGYSCTQKRYKCYCPERKYFIFSADVIFFEFKPCFDNEYHSSEYNEDFLYFLVQEYSVNNTASLDNTDQDTLFSKHGEPTEVYTECTSTMPLIFVVPVSTS